MTEHRTRKGIGALRAVLLLTFAIGLVLASAVPASAAGVAGSASQAVAARSTAAQATTPGVVPQAPIQSCAFTTFCAYPNTGFGGAPIRMVACGRDVSIPFAGNGSWLNNQTSGTRARFKDINHNVIFTTPGAFSGDNSFNWTPVFFVQAC